MLITRKHTVTTLVSLAGFITVLVMNSAQAHSGHAPTQVHSHLGSPMMWLMLGIAALGLTAVVIWACRFYLRVRSARTSRQERLGG